MGLGAIIGNGKQYVSWICLADVAGIIKHVIDRLELIGPINVVAPTPVRQAEFSKSLGRLLSRPVLFRLPSVIMKVVLGQMAEELLLTSTRVLPKKLIESGYRFQHAELEPALRYVLGR
jgi:NAD dependent epimerase/dehydratase family enzyme